MPLVSARCGNEKEGKKCNVIIVMSLFDTGNKGKGEEQRSESESKNRKSEATFLLVASEYPRFTSHGWQAGSSINFNFILDCLVMYSIIASFLQLRVRQCCHCHPLV